MSKDNLYYGLFLSDRQIDFLYKYPQGFDRMKCFATFLQMAVMEPTHYEKKEYSVDLTPGQFAISEVELAKLWKCNRKTASKMVDMFHEVGLVSSVPNCRTTVFTVHCVASWYIGDEVIRNAHYSRHPQIEQRIKANHKATGSVQGITANTASNISDSVTNSNASNANVNVPAAASDTADNNSFSLSSKETEMAITAHQSDGQTIEQRDEYTSKHSYPASHDKSKDCNGREKELSNDDAKEQGEEVPSTSYSDTTVSAVSIDGKTKSEAQPPSEQPDKAQPDATAAPQAKTMPSNAK